jgi:hypothetical protein
MLGRGLVALVPSVDGRIEGACDERLRVLERRGIEVRRSAGCAAIDFARSHMATRALADGFEELLWIDDDIVFDPDDVDALRASGDAFIAGPCAKRGSGGFAFDVLPGTKQITFGSQGGVVDVLYVGTGFLYTRRAVYDAIAKELPVCTVGAIDVVPYFIPFILATAAGHKYLGEDYAFCERARRAGFAIRVDTRLRVFHLGLHGYSWEDAGGHAVKRAQSFVCSFK